MLDKNYTEGIKVVSLFDGISCGRVALERANIFVKEYRAFEIDQNAINVSKFNHSDIIQMGDVIKADFTKYEGYDLLIGGSPCFTKGHLILTDAGLKPIEEIQVGDMVYTHKGRYRKVTAIGHKFSDTYKLKIQGTTELQVTENHPFYTRFAEYKWIPEQKTYKKILQEPKWTEVKDLNKNYFSGSPIITAKENPFNLTMEDCWLLGRYVADGHLEKRKRKDRKNSYHYKVIYSIGSHKVNHFKSKVHNRHFSCYPHSKSVYRCVFASQKFLEFIDNNGFGRGAENKNVPNFILNLPCDLAEEFLMGYLSGDGYYSAKNDLYKSCTVSKKLAYSLALLIQKIYRTNVSISRIVPPKTKVIEGRTVNQKPYYCVEFKPTMNKQNEQTKNEQSKHAKIIDNIVWYPIKKLQKSSTEKSSIETVYNISVEEDESYVCDNRIVHNCQGFSFAGKQLNFNDPRSKLFFEFVRAVKEIKPKYFLLENVVMKKEYENVITKYLGVKPILINSSLVSAQNRNRLYWTNIPNVVLPKDKGIKLIDILECVPINGVLYGKQDIHKATIIGRRINEQGHREDYNKNIPISQCLEVRASNTDKSNCLTTVAKDNVLTPLRVGRYKDAFKNNLPFRNYTVKECCRLQTLPDNYCDCISESAAMKALGNGWTVDVIAWILGFMEWD